MDDDKWVEELTELMLRLPERDRAHFLEVLRALVAQAHGEATATQEALIFFYDTLSQLAPELAG